MTTAPKSGDRSWITVGAKVFLYRDIPGQPPSHGELTVIRDVNSNSFGCGVVGPRIELATMRSKVIDWLGSETHQVVAVHPASAQAVAVRNLHVLVQFSADAVACTEAFLAAPTERDRLDGMIAALIRYRDAWDKLAGRRPWIGQRPAPPVRTGARG
jgi:hypothetical protein